MAVLPRALPRELLEQILPGSSPQVAVPPELGQFAATYKPEFGSVPSSYDPEAEALHSALAADRKRAGFGAMGQNLSRAAALVRGEKVGGMALPPMDDGMKEWLSRQGVDAKRAAAAAAAQDAEWNREKFRAGLGMDERKLAEAAAQREAERAARAAERDEDRDFRRDEGEKNRAAMRDARAAAAESRTVLDEERKARGEQRKTEADAKRYISENFTDTAKPLPPQVLADLQKRDSATAVVLDNADQLERLLSEGGPAVWGQRAGQMEMLANNIWTELKDIKNLGVLAGPDMGILQGILADPTQMRSMVKDATAVRDFTQIVRQFKQRMKDDIRRRVKNYGAEPVEGGLYYDAPAGGAAADVPKPSATGRPRRTDITSGVTKEWDGKAWIPVEG
jgi:hypothetical protein